MLTSKTKSLLLKMILGRLIILLIFNLILGLLLILDIRVDAKIYVGVLLASLNFVAIIYFLSQYKKVCSALKLPTKVANVILRGSAMITLDSPIVYQTALIQFLENKSSKKSNLKVEIGMSSVAIPNMQDPFTAKIFMNDQAPILILNEELGILATISGYFDENL